MPPHRLISAANVWISSVASPTLDPCAVWVGSDAGVSTTNAILFLSLGSVRAIPSNLLSAAVQNESGDVNGDCSRDGGEYGGVGVVEACAPGASALTPNRRSATRSANARENFPVIM